MPTLLIAIRNLFGERGRFIITVTGVTFSVVLIIVLQALYQGWTAKMGQYIEAQDADLWVAQAGSRDMSHSISLLPSSAKQTITDLSSVASVTPFIGKRVGLEIKGKDRIIYLVRYDPTATVGGPVKLIEGRANLSAGEVIIDRVFANNTGFKLGDTITVGNESFTIIGLASGGDLVAMSFAFISPADADRLFQLPNLTSYFLISVSPGADREQVAQAITTAVPNSIVYTKEEFIEINGQFIREAFLPIILVLVLIGVATGIAVIGLTIFTSTIEKAREYGVLKAIGATGGQLNRVVAIQSLTSGLIGYAIGVIVSFLLGIIVGRFVPEFVVRFRLFDFAWIFALAIVMALSAALIPTRRIASINPADVFKA
ncbi:MAG: ABC transporter permease [Candidatus Kerfeldbacteria bacterium]|nr:ABC transporter permease [Candidatus Kerfeldbacteria bacterium]